MVSHNGEQNYQNFGWLNFNISLVPHAAYNATPAIKVAGKAAIYRLIGGEKNIAKNNAVITKANQAIEKNIIPKNGNTNSQAEIVKITLRSLYNHSSDHFSTYVLRVANSSRVLSIIHRRKPKKNIQVSGPKNEATHK